MGLSWYRGGMKTSNAPLCLVVPLLASLLSCSSTSSAPGASPSVEEATPEAVVVGKVLTSEQRESLGGIEAFVSDAYVEKVIATRDSEHWYGFYVAGKKAGYAVLRMRKTKPEEPGVFMARISVQIKADGETMGMEESTFYGPKPHYNVVEIRTSDTTSTGKVSRRLVRKGEKTRVETVVDGERQPDSWAPGICENLRSELGQSMPEFSKISTLNHGKVCAFDTAEQGQEVSELKVLSKGTRLVSGVKIQVIKIAQKDQDAQIWSEMVVAEDGTVLEGNIGASMSLRLEDKEVAQGNVIGLDIGTTAIRLAKPLGDPQKITVLKLRASFAEGFVPPASTPNQKIEKQADGSYHITIRSVPGAEVLPEEKAAALQSSPAINSNDPDIVALAQTLTKGLTNDADKVAVLNHWVYSNLDKSLSTNLSTASQVLAHKTGDCTEHTVLLLALLRAIKIPARELAGLVYMGGDFSAFGWHAWTEVAIEGRWVQVDPSWDEVIGNATHLNLGLEDAMANMGTLTLERL